MDTEIGAQARDTATSQSEGRLMVDAGGKKKRLKSILRKKMDGRGGPGTTDPLTPPLGTAITANTYTPQQQMSMGMMGMQPNVASSLSNTTSPLQPISQKGAMSPFQTMTKKNYNIKKLPLLKARGIPKIKTQKLKKLKGLVAPLKKTPSLI